MDKIVRFVILRGGIDALSMPRGATILSVTVDSSLVSLYARVDPSNDVVTRRFGVVWEGGDVPDRARHVGTAIVEGAREPVPLHVFEMFDDGAPAATSLTDDMLRTLRLSWPVERPENADVSLEVSSCVAEGLMYIEDASNGWVRIGLTDAGRAAARRR